MRHRDNKTNWIKKKTVARLVCHVMARYVEISSANRVDPVQNGVECWAGISLVMCCVNWPFLCYAPEWYIGIPESQRRPFYFDLIQGLSSGFWALEGITQLIKPDPWVGLVCREYSRKSRDDKVAPFYCLPSSLLILKQKSHTLVNKLGQNRKRGKIDLFTLILSIDWEPRRRKTQKRWSYRSRRKTVKTRPKINRKNSWIVFPCHIAGNLILGSRTVIGAAGHQVHFVIRSDDARTRHAGRSHSQ